MKKVITLSLAAVGVSGPVGKVEADMPVDTWQSGSDRSSDRDTQHLRGLGAIGSAPALQAGG